MNLTTNVNGKRVFVTGAASGIGFAVARLFARHGAIVGVNYLPGDARGLAAVAQLSQLEGQVAGCPADVTDEAAIRNAISGFEDKVGTVQILVSNAGIAQHRPFEELSSQDWERMLRVHVLGARNTISAVLPGMLSANFGRIILTASELAFVGAPNLVHYCAAKGALMSLAKALAREVAAKGVTVNCVAPGPVETELLTAYPDEYNEANRLTIPLQRWGDPDEVAWTYLFLASAAASWYTGQVLSPNGGVVM